VSKSFYNFKSVIKLRCLSFLWMKKRVRFLEFIVSSQSFLFHIFVKLSSSLLTEFYL
jgi:hypothetical protein